MSKWRIVLNVIVCTIFIVFTIVIGIKSKSILAFTVGLIQAILASILFASFNGVADCLEKMKSNNNQLK